MRNLPSDVTSQLLYGLRVFWSYFVTNGPPRRTLPHTGLSTKGGAFLPHKDHQSLTVLLPMSAPIESVFTGGGTKFWPPAAGRGMEAAAGGGVGADDWSAVLWPSAGTAMLFGGSVDHAGVPVLSGKRVMFVSSFTKKRVWTKEPDGSWKRE